MRFVAAVVIASLLFLVVPKLEACTSEEAAQLLADYAHDEMTRFQDLARELNAEFDLGVHFAPEQSLRKILLDVEQGDPGSLVVFAAEYASDPRFLALLEAPVRHGILAAIFHQLAYLVMASNEDITRRHPKWKTSAFAKLISKIQHFIREDLLVYLENDHVWEQATPEGRALLANLLLHFGKTERLVSLFPNEGNILKTQLLPNHANAKLLTRVWTKQAHALWKEVKARQMSEGQIALQTKLRALRVTGAIRVQKALGLQLHVYEVPSAGKRKTQSLLVGADVDSAIRGYRTNRTLPQSWIFRGPYRVLYLPFFEETVLSKKSLEQMPRTMKNLLFASALEGIASRDYGLHRAAFIRFQELVIDRLGKRAYPGTSDFVEGLTPVALNLLLAYQLHGQKIAKQDLEAIADNFLGTGVFSYAAFHALPENLRAVVAAKVVQSRIEGHPEKLVLKKTDFSGLQTAFRSPLFWKTLTDDQKRLIWREHLAVATWRVTSQNEVEWFETLIREELHLVRQTFHEQEIQRFLKEDAGSEFFFYGQSTATQTLLANIRYRLGQE